MLVITFCMLKRNSSDILTKYSCLGAPDQVDNVPQGRGHRLPQHHIAIIRGEVAPGGSLHHCCNELLKLFKQFKYPLQVSLPNIILRSGLAGGHEALHRKCARGPGQIRRGGTCQNNSIDSCFFHSGLYVHRYLQSS